MEKYSSGEIPYLATFLEHLRHIRHLREKTILCYKESIDILSSFMGKNNVFLSSFTNRDATLFVKWMVENGLKPISINRHLSAIKGYFAYLVKNDYLKNDPFLWIKGRKKGKRLPVFLTFEELKCLIHLFDNSTLYDDIISSCIISILVFTGIRRSELLSIGISDIDFLQDKILIYGKGGKERYVYFAGSCKQSINKYLQYRPKSSTDKLLLDENANPYTPASLSALFDKINSFSFTTKHITPHVLRHSFATLLIENNVELNYIQTLLGHSSILSTDVYIHTSQNRLFESYDKTFSNSFSKEGEL